MLIFGRRFRRPLKSLISTHDTLPALAGAGFFSALGICLDGAVSAAGATLRRGR